MRRKNREKKELERTRERKEKELEVQADDFYFYKVSMTYNIYKIIFLIWLHLFSNLINRVIKKYLINKF